MINHSKNRPPLTYFGSKWRIAPKIIKWFPKHMAYVEPFGGGASILLRKEPSKVEVYNDLYDDVVNFFRLLRDRPDELIRVLFLTPQARREHEYCKHIDTSVLDDIERARVFFVRSWLDYRPAGSGGWTGYKRWISNITHPTPSIEQLYIIAERLRNVQIECLHAFDVIEDFDKPETFFYIDPPYHDHEYIHNVNHVELASILDKCNGLVALSCRYDKDYLRLYRGWNIIRMDANNMKSKNSKECLIMNYDLI